MALLSQRLEDAIQAAEDRTGQRMIRILTPSFNIRPGGPPENEPEVVLDQCKEFGATLCLPHQCVTNALIDRMHGEIRDIDKYTQLIREREMIPGLSTHMPEAVTIGTTTPDEAREVIKLSLDLLSRRAPDIEL